MEAIHHTSTPLLTDPTIEKINQLNTEESVRDILKGWYELKKAYWRQIKEFKFDSKAKAEFKRLAQELYYKYLENPPSQGKAVWEEDLFNESCSIWFYEKENYPLFAFPWPIIVADSINPDVFYQLLREWSSSYVTFGEFCRKFWNIKRASKANFSPADLQLLQALFSKVETQSCIGVPSIPELRQSNWSYSDSNFRVRRRRLEKLNILYRQSVISN